VRCSIGFASPVHTDSMPTALATRYTLAPVTSSYSASMSSRTGRFNNEN
jgi:hypothetical protein